MRAPRPTPADFAEQVERLNGYKSLQRHYRCGQPAIERWLKEAGISFRRDSDEPPVDLADMAAQMTGKQLMKHYHAGYWRMSRWLAQTGIKTREPLSFNRIPVPADFAEIAPTLTKAELLTRYGITQYKTLNRWIEDSGVQAKAPPAKVTPIRHTGGGLKLPGYGVGYGVQLTRTTSIHDLAADVLRRERWNVNRCDERGRYAEKGKFWRVGTVVCDGDALLARAERYRRRAA